MSVLTGSKGDFCFSICTFWDRALSIATSRSHVATTTPQRRRLRMCPALPPAPTQTSCCCPHPHAGTGTHNDGQSQEGPATIRHKAGLRVPQRIQHRPSAARAELHNTSYSRIPMALLEESDYPAECYLTHPKENLYFF